MEKGRREGGEGRVWRESVGWKEWEGEKWKWGEDRKTDKICAVNEREAIANNTREFVVNFYGGRIGIVINATREIPEFLTRSARCPRD